MRLVRIMLLVLLALNLPGWAVAAMPGCSSQHDSMQQAASGDADAHMHAAMADNDTTHASHCCADGKSMDDQPSGTACGDGGHCQCGTFYQAAQPLDASIVPAIPGIGQTPSFRVITASALPLWRPPTTA